MKKHIIAVETEMETDGAKELAQRLHHELTENRKVKVHSLGVKPEGEELIDMLPPPASSEKAQG